MGFTRITATACRASSSRNMTPIMPATSPSAGRLGAPVTVISSFVSHRSRRNISRASSMPSPSPNSSVTP